MKEFKFKEELGILSLAFKKLYQSDMGENRLLFVTGVNVIYPEFYEMQSGIAY